MIVEKPIEKTSLVSFKKMFCFPDNLVTTLVFCFCFETNLEIESKAESHGHCNCQDQSTVANIIPADDQLVIN